MTVWTVTLRAGCFCPLWGIQNDGDLSVCLTCGTSNIHQWHHRTFSTISAVKDSVRCHVAADHVKHSADRDVSRGMAVGEGVRQPLRPPVVLMSVSQPGFYLRKFVGNSKQIGRMHVIGPRILWFGVSGTRRPLCHGAWDWG